MAGIAGNRDGPHCRHGLHEGLLPLRDIHEARVIGGGKPGLVVTGICVLLKANGKET